MKRTRRSLVTLALALLPGMAVAAGAARPAVISLADLRGTIKKRAGRPLVLHVWASWCQPCVQELPVVAGLLREARERGIEVYSVSLDQPNENAAARMAQVLDIRGGEAINRTILRVEDSNATIAQVDPDWEGDIPAFFAYDRTGKLHRAHVGEMTRKEFDALIAGLVPPVKK